MNSPLSVDEVIGKIFHQNMLEATRFLPDNFVDVLLVDPPYNLTKSYAGSTFKKTSSDDYEEWLDEWLSSVMHCLKNDASIYVCSEWKSSASVQRALERHFIVRNRITWEREKGRGAHTNWKNCSEDIWFCTMSNEYHFDVESVKLKRKVIAPYRNVDGKPKDWSESPEGNYRLTFPSNLWTDITLPFWSMPENTNHPTQKPEKLIAKLLLASSEPGDVVLDPFAGSGTTCVVAKKLKRSFVGVEKEEEYCAIAVKRLALADLDDTIQGYHDGFFWERNSLAAQKSLSPTKKIAGGKLFDE